MVKYLFDELRLVNPSRETKLHESIKFSKNSLMLKIYQK